MKDSAHINPIHFLKIDFIFKIVERLIFLCYFVGNAKKLYTSLLFLKLMP